ncbi:MAG: hypothetical protein P9L92_08710 [Candidatus Electryonea clarkiae]|nr:hypothetical protein [Candidatus Electryonea clarkiae]MDP8287426.1 hypothetical protein [Candidatus Electryonea clarkiae]
MQHPKGWWQFDYHETSLAVLDYNARYKTIEYFPDIKLSGAHNI